MWKSWANLLTLLRLACVVPCAWAMAHGDWLTAAALFTIAVITDFLDGPLARRLGTASPFGGLFDHATDAAFVTVALGTLGYLGYVPVWLAPLVALAFIQYMFDSSALQGHVLRASWLGRNNGVAYFVVVGFPVIRNAVGLDWPADPWILAAGWLLVLTTALSMLDRGVALLLVRKRQAEKIRNQAAEGDINGF
ncbi:MAG: CDP-alcohol phosphatidyltransferase family protein [Pseudomonadales bacterium]|nr:CDP-alcohol phosphatidyltransferase family protein [Pseudomonadales bacterium]